MKEKQTTNVKNHLAVMNMRISKTLLTETNHVVTAVREVKKSGLKYNTVVEYTLNPDTEQAEKKTAKITRVPIGEALTIAGYSKNPDGSFTVPEATADVGAFIEAMKSKIFFDETDINLIQASPTVFKLVALPQSLGFIGNAAIKVS